MFIPSSLFSQRGSQFIDNIFYKKHSSNSKRKKTKCLQSCGPYTAIHITQQFHFLISCVFSSTAGTNSTVTPGLLTAGVVISSVGLVLPLCMVCTVCTTACLVYVAGTRCWLCIKESITNAIQWIAGKMGGQTTKGQCGLHYIIILQVILKLVDLCHFQQWWCVMKDVVPVTRLHP